MNDFISIGSSPAEETCAQLGDENYGQKAKAECQRFVELIRKKLGEESNGARLCVMGFPHDFGTYFEVVCKYDPTIPGAMDYAMRCEAEAPTTWE